MIYFNLNGQTILKIKTIFSSKTKWQLGNNKVFKDTCPIRYISCYDMLNHTLEYCNNELPSIG